MTIVSQKVVNRKTVVRFSHDLRRFAKRKPGWQLSGKYSALIHWNNSLTDLGHIILTYSSITVILNNSTNIKKTNNHLTHWTQKNNYLKLDLELILPCLVCRAIIVLSEKKGGAIQDLIETRLCLVFNLYQFIIIYFFSHLYPNFSLKTAVSLFTFFFSHVNFLCFYTIWW